MPPAGTNFPGSPCRDDAHHGPNRVSIYHLSANFKCQAGSSGNSVPFNSIPPTFTEHLFCVCVIRAESTQLLSLKGHSTNGNISVSRKEAN